MHFKILLSNGLVEASKKLVNTIKSESGIKTLFFKDVFKPLYYAVEYFDKPEEIQNLPGEVAEVVNRIRERFLG